MFSIYVETICIDMHEDEKGSDVLKRINNKLGTKYNTLWLGNLDVSEGLLADNGVSSESHLKASFEQLYFQLNYDELHKEKDGYCSDEFDKPRYKFIKAKITKEYVHTQSDIAGCGGCGCCKLLRDVLVSIPLDKEFLMGQLPSRDTFDVIIRRCMKENGYQINIDAMLINPTNLFFERLKKPADPHKEIHEALNNIRLKNKYEWKRTYSGRDDVSSTDLSSDWSSSQE